MQRTRSSTPPRPFRIALGVATALSFLLSVSCKPAEPAVEPEAPAASQGSTASPVAPSNSAEEYGTLPPEQREAPPPPSPSPKWVFPTIHDAKLPNGMELKVVERTTLPLVQITLMVRSGQATDGPKPGVAVLAGEMLKVGGTAHLTSQQLLNEVESMGSSLNVLTSRESTTITVSVTSDRFEEALKLLGLIALKPQFNTTEFNKLKRREMDRVSSQAKTSADWAASMVLYRELFRTAGGKHPYATYDATSEQIEQVSLWEVKQWYQTHFSPKNATLVVAGDVSQEQLKSSAGRAFNAWRGAAVAKAAAPTPELEQGLKVYLVDRPKSSQAEVRLALFGPTYASPEYPKTKVVNQVLGGGVAGRLFGDVREKRSLAYSTYSAVERVPQGPLPIILRAGTQTAKAGLTLQALLQHAEGMVANPPSAEETALASRYLSDLFLLQMESVGSLGSMVTNLAEYQLPNDYYDTYRASVSSTTHAEAVTVSKKYFGTGGKLIVVAGDAERLAAPLSHFADVTVVNPEKGFAEVRQVPHDPSAKLELEREDGT